MTAKKILSVLLCIIMLLGTFSTMFMSYALVICETQYNYDSVNLSWLKGLNIKENMTTIEGLSSSVKYKPIAKYPYRETADSFSEEIAYYKILYTLDENMADAAYLYLLSLAEQFASSAISGYSDEYIRSYLESQGIVYPTGSDIDDSEARIVARAFFAVISKDENYKVKPGTGLYDAFTAYISVLLGVPLDSVLRFDASGELTGLEEYVIAACKLALFNAGYDVKKDTPKEEVYRLIAIMTIRAQGITIDSKTATFEEIRDKYLCAMMCKIYDVPIDYKSFITAVNGNLDFYMLQCIGKENGITIRDSMAYEEAFKTICEKTDYFNLEPGEFYADIFEYDAPLKYKRDRVWIYPETLGVTSESEGTKVIVKIGGKQVRENYYVDIALDNTKEKESIDITVEYTDNSGTKSSTYKINFIQGKETEIKGPDISSALGGVSDIVSKLLSEVGINSSISGLLATVPFEIPKRILGSGLLFPEIDANSIGSSFLQMLFGYTNNDNNVNQGSLGGIGGQDAFNSSGDPSISLNFNANDLNNSLSLNLDGLPQQSTPAPNVVIDNNPIEQPNTITIKKSEHWLTELISDPKIVCVIAVALIITFGACFMLFNQILKLPPKRRKSYEKRKK